MSGSQQGGDQVVGVKAPRGSSWFEVRFADDFVERLPNEILRGYCPCAACQGHGGEIRFQTGRDTDLREIEEVGRYGLRFVWGDGHGEGIHTFTHIRELCELHRKHGDQLPVRFPTLPRAGK